MIIYNTKYALTKGILVQKVKVSKFGDMVRIARGKYLHKPDWHTNQSKAILRATGMRDRKIKALKKQLARLEKIDFTEQLTKNITDMVDKKITGYIC